MYTGAGRSIKLPTPITAADRVLPFFEEHDVKLLRVLTDRGSEYCGQSRAARV
jgi:hypothetical protein